MQLSPFPYHFAPLSTKYSPQHPILKHPQPAFLPQCQRPVSHPYKTTGKIIVLIYYYYYYYYYYYISKQCYGHSNVGGNCFTSFLASQSLSTLFQIFRSGVGDKLSYIRFAMVLLIRALKKNVSPFPWFHWLHTFYPTYVIKSLQWHLGHCFWIPEDGSNIFPERFVSTCNITRYQNRGICGSTHRAFVVNIIPTRCNNCVLFFAKCLYLHDAEQQDSDYLQLHTTHTDRTTLLRTNLLR